MILDLSHFPKYLSLSTSLRSLCPVIGTSPPPLSVKKGALQKAQNKKKYIGQLRKELADVSFCGRIKLLMNNSNRQEKYNVSCENNQLVLVLNSEILLPEDAPVRVTSAQLEELDYRKLYEAYSSKGRKSVTIHGCCSR